MKNTLLLCELVFTGFVDYNKGRNCLQFQHTITTRWETS